MWYSPSVNQYLKNLLAVTQVLITKDLQQERILRINPDYDYVPYFDIFDADIKDAGMTFASFCTTLGELDKKGYLDLNLVVGFNDKITGLPDHTDTFKKIMATAQERQPDVRFHVFVKGNIWRLHDVIAKEEDTEKITIGTSAYLPDEYTLVVHDYRVPIKLKNDAPNEHYILSHMMKNGFQEAYDFSELNEQEILGDKKENLRPFYDSCKNLNDKIDKATKGKVRNFLLVHAGDTGSVRINPKYL